MIPGIDPTDDYVFKKVFGSEPNVPVLLHLLDAVLQPPPEQRIVGLELRNPFNEKDFLDDKLSVLDIKARDERGRQYNIEMQMVAEPIFPHRVLYYWSELHSDQLHEGDDYRQLQPTISVCFVNSLLFPQAPEYHLDFRLRSSQRSELVFSDHLWIHMVELSKFKKKAAELASPLDVWCYFLAHGAELDTDNLPGAMRVQAFEQAMEVLRVISQNDQERERHRARLKARRDAYTALAMAHDKGLSEGRAEGEAKGRTEARAEGMVDKIKTLQRLLKQPLTPDNELLANSLEQLQAKAKELERLLGLE